LDEPERVDEYYQITNAGNLMWFASQVNEGQTAINAKLTADIDMNGIDWTIMSSFAGTFDGNGYTISGLNGHKADTGDTHGFIRTLADGGVVKNLTFTEADIWNHEGSGAISAVIVYTNNGTVENCVVKSSLIQHGNYDALGVVVGVNGGTIRNCASISNTMTRRFSSAKDICGFVWSNSGSIENCFNYDCTYQNGSNRYAFTGINNGTITNCYYYESSETISDTVVDAKTADQFASGEVAYLLQSTQTADEETGIVPHVWGQTLTGENKQACPVLGSAKVYYGYTACNSTEKSYSNSEIGNEKPQHIFEEDSNGFCTVCGAYEQPETDENGVYQISNAGELYWFAEYVNAGNTSANAVLTADIVVNSGKVAECNGTKGAGWKDWTPIGNYLNKYTGTFEGNNKTISGLYFNDTTVEYVGLFGYIGSNAKIKNVGVVNSYFKGKGYVGGVCGYIGNSTIITNCYNKGSVSGGDSVGGVCGRNFKGTITNCYNKGSVGGNEDVGGVCGYNNSGTITNCYNTGSVTATGDSAYVGGVCGYNYIGTITRCYYDNTVYTGNAVRKNVGGTVGADVLGKSTAQFNSGEVAYLLNGSTSENVTWYQTLETDTYPVLDSKHGIVYSVFKCDGTTPAGYSNVNEPVHDYTHTVVPPTYYEEGYTLHECVGMDDSYEDNYTDKLVLPAISNLALKSRNYNSITLSWAENEAASGYILQQYKNDAWVNIANIKDNATTSYQITGLAANTSYKFRAVAYVTDGKSTAYSSYTSALTISTAPAMTTGFAITGRGSDFLTITWTKNAGASGYIIQEQVNGVWKNVASIKGNATTSYKVANLQPNSFHRYRMVAYKTDSNGTCYGKYTGSVPGYTAPAMVSNFKVSGIGADSLTVSWDKVTSANGYVIDIYRDGKWSQLAKITSNATTSYKASDLTLGTTYKFRIKSYATNGTLTIYSTYSSAISGVPTLSKVENLRMTNRGTDFISVRWDKNESADGYMVYIYDGTKWTCVKTLTTASSVSHKITGLASGKAYKVTVKAFKTVNGKKFISDTATISANTL
ncbi:MAG: fibronectin type III domain-containing protein, partial [Ruminiclostridium sp.]|nr:fibronectin type III domain-containing protein [Ruminiclostridium sp.]